MMMTPSWKVFIAIGIAISIRPLVTTLIWLKHAPADDFIGKIPLLSTEDLMTHVKGKNALLIGGTRGVGMGTALALYRAGAHVTIVGRSDHSGAKAIASIQQLSPSTPTSTPGTINFVQGDIGTICTTMKLIEQLSASPKSYDFAVVSAATFPDWTKPLQNDDGLDKSFAIAVVGRFLVYRNAHLFMNRHARIVNILAAGEKLPIDLFDREIASGERDVTGLFEAMITFAIGNEIMMDGLYTHDDHFASKDYFTMVSTHPGLLKTDLHRGQGFLFDMLETAMVSIAGTTEEEVGVLQSSILVSKQLHLNGLSFVDSFGYGRVHDVKTKSFIEENSSWLWKMLSKLEKSSAKCSAV
mmetsp:Transcript_12619/g.19465  ORF Transcript_12619/g.19465 Transcript_12619/m.19465 type:complete len:355 (-) Transcript_12619:57-1121(-)